MTGVCYGLTSMALAILGRSLSWTSTLLAAGTISIVASEASRLSTSITSNTVLSISGSNFASLFNSSPTIFGREARRFRHFL